MKKVYIMVCSINLLIIGFITVMVFGSKRIIFTENGVTYALTVDGKSQNSFPSKGMYRVDTECENAACKWDYDAWKLYIEEITGDVSCNISFTTITKTKFNDYLIQLSGSEQGLGAIIHETFSIGKYEESSSLTLQDYSENAQYYTPWSTGLNTSGNIITNAYNFDNNNWVSSPENMNSDYYYHFAFTISKDGAYEICYELPSGNNSIDIFKNSFKFTTLYSSSTTLKDCIDLGFNAAGTSYTIRQPAYNNNANFKFNFMQTSVYDNYDAGYRYEGKDPNNYVWFNNELWRIIGVMNDDSHGISGQKLVKLISNSSIGSVVWNTADNNDWEKSSLNNLLNNNYYNSINANDNIFCKKAYDSNPANCNYTVNGIKESYRKMIKETTWYLGGLSNNESDNNYYDNPLYSVYNFERNGAGSSSNKNLLKTTQKIGLPYISDYRFAFQISDNCSRYYCSSYSTYNWLKKGDGTWFITPGTNLIGGYISSQVFAIAIEGHITYTRTVFGQNVRPTLYLNENVYVYAGDGSITDPYIIGMD